MTAAYLSCHKEDDTMKPFILIAALLFTLVIPLIAPEESAAALTYTRVKVEAVDAASQRLTFKTAEGEVWTLAALSPDILGGLHKGDTCSLEIDVDNRVTKIVKIDSTSP
jgi:hypothetical protein